MPLRPGSSEETIRANILKLISEGYPENQAIAVALSHAHDACATLDGGGCPLCAWEETSDPPSSASSSGLTLKIKVEIPLGSAP